MVFLFVCLMLSNNFSSQGERLRDTRLHSGKAERKGRGGRRVMRKYAGEWKIRKKLFRTKRKFCEFDVLEVRGIYRQEENV